MLVIPFYVYCYLPYVILFYVTVIYLDQTNEQYKLFIFIHWGWRCTLDPPWDDITRLPIPFKTVHPWYPYHSSSCLSIAHGLGFTDI